MRQHKDITKESAPFYRKAKKFYDGLASELVKSGHVVDIFACALDQVRPPSHPQRQGRGQTPPLLHTNPCPTPQTALRFCL